MATVYLNAIRLEGIVGADRTLTVQLPLEVPDGPVELVVLLPEKPESPADPHQFQNYKTLTALKSNMGKAQTGLEKYFEEQQCKMLR